MKATYLEMSQRAEEILRRGSPLIMEGYAPNPGSAVGRTASMQMKTKSSHKDLVTFYDKRMDEFLKSEFEAAFPGIPVIGEENVAAGKKSVEEIAKNFDAFWIFDPIDGTTNFSRAYPFFCTTAAFAEKKNGKWKVQSAVTYNPVNDELFTASRGNGAFLNRQKLRVSQVKEPPQALLTTGFASERSSSGERAFELFKKLTKLTLGVRRDGSAALDLAFVANGRIDAYWEWGLSPWDTGAGILLVEEAGGECSHHDGSELNFFSGEILSSNGFLHKWLLDRIKE